VDHVTVYRWVQRFAPLLIDAARPCRHAPGDRWYVNETYVKVAGRWINLYRAIDPDGQVIDVLARAKRRINAACPSHPPADATGPAEVGDTNPVRSLSGSDVDTGPGACAAPLERAPLVLAHTTPHASILP
jgi:hypothetical protein